MTLYVQALIFVVPGFLLMMLIELVGSHVKGIKVYRGADTISSLSSGLTNVMKDVLGLAVVIVSYAWMVDKFAVFTIESTVGLYVAAFVAQDFTSYWIHRFNHRINVLWNRHLIHHSSEEFNMACALRQPISTIFMVMFVLYVPMAVIGIPADVVAIVAPVHLFLQFWYHTRLIGNMGIVEHVLVTPSNHRVHHAINDEYIDKNYAAIFVIWDKLFGTFQKELSNVPPVYGVRRPARSWNPILINFKHSWQLLKDAWHAQSWYDKLRIWFMPTGWRPADVAVKYPVHAITDVYNFTKYSTDVPKPLMLWSAFQLTLHTLLVFHLFLQVPDAPFGFVLAGALFLYLSIAAYTSLMDRSMLALVAESLKLAVGLMVIYSLKGWFNLAQFVPVGDWFFIGYLFASLLVTVFYTRIAKSDEPAASVASRSMG